MPADADKNLDYTLEAGTPSFVTIVQSTPGVFKVRIYTTSTADTGIYTITVLFHEYFSGLSRTTTFVLTVSCVTSILDNGPMAPQLYYI